MTCDSIDSRPIRSRRESSRSTSLRTSSGSGCSASFFLSSSRSAASLPSPSPSSFWIARSCSRRSISRWRSPICSLTLDWMSSCAERTPIWRCTWTSTRRRRSSTESVSRSCWRSAAGMSMYPATRSARRPGSSAWSRNCSTASSGRPSFCAELGGALARFLVEREEDRVLRVRRRHLGRVHDDRLQHPALLLRHAHRDAAALALEEEAHPAEAALDRAHLRDRPDRVEAVRRHALDVRALGEREDERLRLAQRRLDRADRPRAARGDRRRHAGEEHGVAEGEDREGQGFRHGQPNVGHSRAIPQCESKATQVVGRIFLRMV